MFYPEPPLTVVVVPRAPDVCDTVPEQPIPISPAAGVITIVGFPVYPVPAVVVVSVIDEDLTQLYELFKYRSVELFGL